MWLVDNDSISRIGYFSILIEVIIAVSVKIKFLGASGTVTGSKYLVSHNSTHILVDAGIFQGEREWREKNWNEFTQYSGVEPGDLAAVVLTHAHIDHSGLLPKLWREGLRCPIFATSPTVALGELLLKDFAKIQEEEASYRNPHGYSRFKPALPLCTDEEAHQAIKLFRTVRINQILEVTPGVKACWKRMGHILGACSISLELGGKRLVFSGDVGRYSVPILKDPDPVEFGDLLLIESTYGDREHPESDPEQELAKVINSTASRGGVVLIPSFAVGRAQLLLYYLNRIKDNKTIPDIPIIVDSPMARDATDIYSEFSEEYDSQAIKLLESGQHPFLPSKVYFIRSREESIKLNSITDPMVIISASGMLNGGRILHHLLHRISSPLNSLLFVGYQAVGSKGAWIKSGADTVRIFKQNVAIRASIHEISSLSAHGDRTDLLRWCKESTEFGKRAPGEVRVVHGEPQSALAFADTLSSKLKWSAKPAKYLECLEL